LSLVINNLYIQVIALSITGVYGLIFLKQTSTDRTKIKNKSFKLPKKLGFVSLLLFFLLLTVLPIASSMTNNLWLKMFDSFYSSSSLGFGGCHVVLPLLKNEFVPFGLLSPDSFITGYAAALAVPGPLFTFASYIGMSMEGIGGAILATIAIFLPAFLLLFGIFPFWDNINSNIYA